MDEKLDQLFEELKFIKLNMVTKTELENIKLNMATRTELGTLEKNIGTMQQVLQNLNIKMDQVISRDLALLHAQMDQIFTTELPRMHNRLDHISKQVAHNTEQEVKRNDLTEKVREHDLDIKMLKKMLTT